MIVLDTDILSDLMRATPAAPVLRWFAVQSAAILFTTTLTQAEILSGLSLLPDCQRRDDLVAAERPIFAVELAGRVLSFGQDVAMAYAAIAGGRRREDQPISQIDGQIVAITASRGARLATRNVKDSFNYSIKLVNP
jgi:predicted nucleic acid-binding protein